MNGVLLLRKLAGRYPRCYKLLSSIALFLGRNKGVIRSRRNFQFDNSGFYRKCRFSIFGAHTLLTVGKGAYLEDCSFHIEGKDCKIFIGEGCTLRGVEFWIEDDAGTISIGKETKTFGNTQLAVIEGQTINIGDDCLLAKGIQVRVGDSHSIISVENYQRINCSKGVTIGNHVWMGEKVTILKGVNIGENSVIGTGAIVTDNIPKNTIAAGVPAKIVKENITWDIQRIN